MGQKCPKRASAAGWQNTHEHMGRIGRVEDGRGSLDHIVFEVLWFVMPSHRAVVREEATDLAR